MVDTKSLEKIIKEYGFIPKNLKIENNFCNSKEHMVAECMDYGKKDCPKTCHYAKEMKDYKE